MKPKILPILIICFIVCSVNKLTAACFADNFYLKLYETQNYNKFRVEEIEIEGNKLTKPDIILRELTFSKGDNFTIDQLNLTLQRSKENLLNTSLFNFVTINSEIKNNSEIYIQIIVEEKWYLWPIPILSHADRNLAAWIEKKDMSMINYGLFLHKENFRGRRETLKLKARFGFKEQFNILYIKPYIDKFKKHGIAGEISYNRQKEVSIRTINNKPDYFMHNNEYLMKHLYGSVFYTFRPGLNSSHIISTAYNIGNVLDTVLMINPYFYMEGKKKMSYYSLSYTFIHDLRDSRVYPLRGWYLNIGLEKIGIGITKNSPDIFWMNLKYRKYGPITKKTYYSLEGSLKKSFGGFQPYYLKKALGYDDFLRGFEYYVVDGQDFALLKSGINYELVSRKEKQISFIPSQKFNKIHYTVYLSGYFDMAYVNNKHDIFNNNMSNSYLYSGGLGLSFVTYYDRVFKIQYSINNFGEKGIFLHFTSPIISVFY
ncbi:POTRA domain-containing protein [Bacteroidota bacterium]